MGPAMRSAKARKASASMRTTFSPIRFIREAAANGNKFAPRSGLPLVQEGNYVVGIHGARGLKLALLLAVDQLAVGAKNRQCRDSLVDGNLVKHYEVGVLLSIVPNIDVNDIEILVDQGRDILFVKSGIEDVAVIAPAAA